MASDNQTAANCIHAQKSTGSRSAAGKTQSAQNARKHGFCRPELEEENESNPISHVGQAPSPARDPLVALPAGGAILIPGTNPIPPIATFHPTASERIAGPPIPSGPRPATRTA